MIDPTTTAAQSASAHANQPTITVDVRAHHPRTIAAFKQLMRIGLQHHLQFIRGSLTPLVQILTQPHTTHTSRSNAQSREQEDVRGTVWEYTATEQNTVSPDDLVRIIQQVGITPIRVAGGMGRSRYFYQEHARQFCAQLVQAYADKESLQPLFDRFLNRVMMEGFVASYNPRCLVAINHSTFERVLAQLNIWPGQERYNELMRRYNYFKTDTELDPAFGNPVLTLELESFIHSLQTRDSLHSTDSMWNSFFDEMRYLLSVYARRVNAYEAQDEKPNTSEGMVTWLVDGMFVEPAEGEAKN